MVGYCQIFVSVEFITLTGTGSEVVCPSVSVWSLPVCVGGEGCRAVISAEGRLRLLGSGWSIPISSEVCLSLLVSRRVCPVWCVCLCVWHFWVLEAWHSFRLWRYMLHCVGFMLICLVCDGSEACACAGIDSDGCVQLNSKRTCSHVGS